MASTDIARHQPISTTKFYDQLSQPYCTVDAPIDPSQQKIAATSSSGPQRALRSEALRLATFQGWPLDFLHPRDLSAAGFFYRGLADQTQCAFCCITISQWEPHDNPMVEHRRHAPNCSFILQLPVGNIPLSSSRGGAPAAPSTSSPLLPLFTFPSLGGGGADTCSRFQNESRPNALPERVPATALTIRPTNSVAEGPSTSGNLSTLSLLPHQQARHPELSTMEARMNTFADWPPGLEQRPAQLAEAGFYYLKTGDHVKCYCCDGALRNWEPNDDPWVEHARWFSRCNFLVSVKGIEYIRDIQSRHEQNSPAADGASVDVVQEKSAVKEEKTPAIVQATPGTSSGSEEASPNKLRDSLLCQICYDQQLSMVFIPCGHSLCCPSCSTALTMCPLCRKPIEATVRAFFPFS